jgi:cellulose synthase/poly-beta-1,6-N-acetylglucosamine synthase-like glycosyltransferase
VVFVLLPVVVGLYAYAAYPGLLWLVGAIRGRGLSRGTAVSETLPELGIVVIAHNEVANIAKTIETLLQLDYPRDRIVQFLVVSDSSTDGTDEIVAGFADRGVELIRTPRRMGKTAAENFSLAHLRGDILLNTDAAVRVDRGAARALVSALADPAVGLASGIDISVSSARNESNGGESQYVGYEMWIRELETRAGGIVGASGCLFAIRRPLHLEHVPLAAVRDFAAPLMVKSHGLRSVSVPDAVCYVPRTAFLRAEYRRKVRTFQLGMETLLWQRRHLNPANDALFAWKLFSHKLARYLLAWTFLPALAVLVVTGDSSVRIAMALGANALAGAAALGLRWPFAVRQPALLAVVSIGVASNVAVLHATIRTFRGSPNHLWEPTRRTPGRMGGNAAAFARKSDGSAS